MPKDQTPIDIRGQIERITYSNPENGYTVAKVRIPGRPDLVTVVGTLLSTTAGEGLVMTGYWDVHPRFGQQFKIISYQSVVPASIAGIEKYLGSGMIKGIGPVMAKRLVAKFGKETLSIIEEEIDRLHEVEGIGEKRVDMIRAAWDEQREVREVMVFLQGQGVSPAYAVKIYRHYGRDAIGRVSENPYRLATDIFGIGFLTADRIAEKLGIPRDSQVRAEAGILYVLYQLADEGHVYYPYEALLEKCGEILDMERSRLIEALRFIAGERKVVIEEKTTLPGAAGEETPRVYLMKYYLSEVGIVERISNLLARPKQLRLLNVDEAIGWVQKSGSLSLSKDQLQAVRDSIHCKVMVITGGPGTGKTTIINSILRIHAKMGQKVLLAAPTGRAAKRMTEATGREAKTIHRLLEYSPAGGPGDGGFKRNQENPLDADLIIIDEVSMVDSLLMNYFLKAVPDAATLILVGDVDQLPSVGAGNVLKDIIESGCLVTVRLQEIFRQSRESMIVVNAHRINRGEMPAFDISDGHKRDFRFYVIEEPEKVLAKIVSLCKEEIPALLRCNPLEDIQVLAPMHRGSVGVANLNTELQKELNHSTDELGRGGRIFRVSDKVMQLRNNYDKDVYNGDIGRIAAIDREEQEVAVDFEGRRVSYEYFELDELTHAYAASVHKAQGSEYPVVIMPVLTQHYMLLQRNLLYTGITRGKRLVVLVGTKKALAIAIRNDKPQKRYSLLRERLAKAVGSKSEGN
jgi:exodeoxyribonuclease V alpha subunit